MDYINEIWNKLDKKLSGTAVKSFDKIPYTTINGVHDNKAQTDITWWTNGFWPALMLLMYNTTGKEVYLNTFLNGERMLDDAFKNRDWLHHDVGFMWHLSSGAHYRLTGDKLSRSRALFAADMLVARFMPKGGFIRAWNDEENLDRTGWTIIDCMMNIPLLYWASDELNVSNYRDIAMMHADMTLRDHIRPDGSVNHICIHNSAGELTETLGGQGYCQGSAWSRGQAWAIYGFAQSYTHTKAARYLDAARKTADFFIASLGDSFIPVSDFRAPKEPVIYDTTAGAIAACGMITLAGALDKEEGRAYLDTAIKIITETESRFCDWSEEEDSIVQMGSESYHGKKGQLPIIYGDYYFAEAVSLLMGFDRTN
ncbi:MAG: glycoside hydrolase family 88 protein [Clostridia bacterium]|nr:glycoside hydrolase family 88 protein [Clostridia bacterium]